ncbi:hypothetical protein LPY66_16970 [Dehalobacter sp. DCM]|uniref:YfjL-like protein n=1 Tax=Dehalobacter sp. DCM TaxID=2907827 RepID=UPI003081EC87|nr:hypothetical protein LPY66_16970 [Dehalobacter sp. DCM]
MKRFVKILACVLALVLFGGILWFANGLVGNPVSRMLAENAAKNYIADNYPDLQLELADATYNFKSSNYSVIAKSPTSIDTHFYMAISSRGQIKYDSYKDDVLQKRNTYDRINNGYGSMADTIFESEDFPYTSYINYAELIARPDTIATHDRNPFEPEYGLNIEALELDKKYNVAELGKTAGHIVFYTEDEDVSIKKAAEIMLDLKNILDQNKVFFYAIDFVLEKPRLDEKPNPDDPAIRVSGFLYSDIYENGLEQRIEVAHDALQKYYAEEDAKRAEFEATLNK